MSTVNINNTDNQVTAVNANQSIIITDNGSISQTSITVTQPVTSIISVNALGPIGPQGPQGPQGSVGGSNFVTTASFNAFTGSYNTGSFTGSFTGNLIGTASYVTGSVFTSANPALSASYALTASYALNGGTTFPFTGSAIISGSLIVTGSIRSTLGFTGSLFGTASWAVSASRAISALNAVSSSTSLISNQIRVINPEGGFGNEGYISFTQANPGAGFTSPEYLYLTTTLRYNFPSNVLTLSKGLLGAPAPRLNIGEASTGGFINLSGSLNIYNSGSAALTISGSTGPLLQVNDIISPNIFTVQSASVAILNVNTGSVVTISGSLEVTSGITGSLFGTASYAITASYAMNGGGTPAGNDFEIQYNDHGVFGASPRLTFDNTNNNLVLTGSFLISSSNTFTNIGPSIFSGSVNVSSSLLLNNLPVLVSTDIVSFLTTSSFNNFTSSYNTGSFTGSFTGNLIGTASYVTGSVFTSTNLALSASYALTASYIAGVTVFDTGSLLVTASVNLNTITLTKGDGSSFPITVNTGSGGSTFPYTGSAIISGSLTITGSLNAPSITGSLFGTASYALNGGVTQLLAGSNISLSPTNGLGQVTITSTGGGSSFNTATGSYGSFYSTITQTNVAGTARSMSLNVTDITNGVSISGSTDPFNTYIKTENAGVYDLQFSAQVDKTDSGTDEIWIWLRKNGTDLSDTATSVQLTGNGAHYVAAWNFFVNSSANDYYQLMWYSPDANVRLHAEPAFGVVPGIPSLIVTANRIDQFLSNTGSFTGSFTGLLIGTSSYASQSLSSSYALSSSYVENAQTASYVLQAVSSSYASTASYVAGNNLFPYTGSATISGSLTVNGPIRSNIGLSIINYFSVDRWNLFIIGAPTLATIAMTSGSANGITTLLTPFVVAKDLNITSMSFEVTALITATTASLGIYNSDPVSYNPQNLIASCSNIIVSTTGTRSGSLNQILSLTPGLYYTAFQHSGSNSITCRSTPTANLHNVLGLTTPGNSTVPSYIAGVRSAGVFNFLPTTSSAFSTINRLGATSLPSIWIRVVS